MLNPIHSLHQYGKSLHPREPVVPVVLSCLGQVGHVENRRGLYLNPSLKRHVRNLVREHVRAERTARELTGGRFGADDLLPVAALGTDSRDAIRAIKDIACAITSWDGVTAARGNGKSWDFMGQKLSQVTVASVWSSFARSGGAPAAMTYTNIPGGAAVDKNTVGAWPLPMTIGGTEDLYLTNFGCNHLTGTNVVLLVDLLVNAANISATVTTAQTVNTTALTRNITGEGVHMTAEVTTALGATASNLTLAYTNQGGTGARSTGAMAMTASAIAMRLQPATINPAITLQSGDYGVRSIETATFSASMTAGVIAVLLYKPLILLPTLATATFVERSTPAQVGGIIKLTSAAGGTPGCLTFFVLTSSTATGIQTYFIQTVWG
jgi:hypothetical protein